MDIPDLHDCTEFTKSGFVIGLYRLPDGRVFRGLSDDEMIALYPLEKVV